MKIQTTPKSTDCYPQINSFLFQPCYSGQVGASLWCQLCADQMAISGVWKWTAESLKGLSQAQEARLRNLLAAIGKSISAAFPDRVVKKKKVQTGHVWLCWIPTTSCFCHPDPGIVLKIPFPNPPFFSTCKGASSNQTQRFPEPSLSVLGPRAKLDWY